MAQSQDNPVPRRTGFTLVEMVIALFMAGIVISLAMFSWTFFSRHTMFQQHKSLFYAQTEQAASIIANDIRTSPHVIFFDPNAITFIASRGGDTVTYRLSSDSLRKNNVPLPYFSDGARAVKFSVEREGPAPAVAAPGEQTPPQDVAIVVTLAAQDRTGIISEIRNRMMIRYAEENNAGDRSRWNY
jgi:prepilin-type N-terminal cleavage/methylation domain-containing protein